MSLRSLLKLKTSFVDIRDALFQRIREDYEDADKVFTPASPHGQILTILSAFEENWLFFLEDIANESNFDLAIRQESIFGLSAMAGHNPTRTIASSGIITLSPKVPSEEIRGRFAILNNNTRLRCENNNLQYHIEIESINEFVKLDMLSTQSYKFKIVQGNIEKQTIFSTGEKMFSFSLNSKRNIDNDRIKVSVNGENWKIATSFYDMLRNEKAVILKTNINGGVNIHFGNSSFGMIPAEGAIVEVSYVVSEGFAGNIEAVSNNVSFKFLDNSTTELNEVLDLNEVFLVKMETGINLGSDPESVNFTKNIAPYTSKSFILNRPENYIHFLSRFNFLSTIKAWNTKGDANLDDDNVIYLFLLPDITKYVSKGENYFDIPLSRFVLNIEVVDAIFLYIDSSLRQSLTSELRYVEPILKRYVLNVFLRIFEDSNEILVKTSIKEAISDYFLKNIKKNRIPKSDIIKILEDVEGVDSVNISFTSKDNETAILNGFYNKSVKNLNGSVSEVIINIPVGVDPKLGLDEFGDIIVGDSEVPIIRGGFKDRNGNDYIEGLSTDTFGSLNIFIKEKVKK